jgi:hypothetical protein
VRPFRPPTLETGDLGLKPQALRERAFSPENRQPECALNSRICKLIGRHISSAVRCRDFWRWQRFRTGQDDRRSRSKGAARIRERRGWIHRHLRRCLSLFRSLPMVVEFGRHEGVHRSSRSQRRWPQADVVSGQGEQRKDAVDRRRTQSLPGFPEHSAVRYHNGPIVSPKHFQGLSAYTPLAWFRSETVLHPPQKGTMIDAPAIVSGVFGKGKVISISPHPEASKGLEAMIPAAVKAVFPGRD